MYLYFEPKGGFNDILCGIFESIEYCKKYKRILLVNILKSCYQVNFIDYFVIKNENIIFDMNQIKKICLNKEYKIYPNELQDKMYDILEKKINFNFSNNYKNYVYENILLDLPKNNVSADIIIISFSGDCNIGFKMFKELIFHKNIIDIVWERYERLNKPYLCIQIRNTDYKCEYEKFFNENENEIRSYKEIYLATDDINCLDFYRKKGIPIINFTNFPSTNTYRNLHYSDISPNIKFIDLLCDIFIAGLSDKLMSNSKGGFIQLLRYINKDFKLKNYILK